LFSTIKQEVSTAAQGVGKIVKEKASEVMLIDSPSKKYYRQSNKMSLEVAQRRFVLMEKRVKQIQELLTKVLKSRSIMVEDQRSLQNMFAHKRIGGKKVSAACLEVSRSLEAINNRYENETKTLRLQFAQPLCHVIDIIKVSRGLINQYNDRVTLNMHSPSSPTKSETLRKLRDDFINSVVEVQRYMETELVGILSVGAAGLLQTDGKVDDKMTKALDAFKNFNIM